MKKIHSQEKMQFRDLFVQEAIDRFEDRYRILDVFLQTEGHVTISELVEALAASGTPFAEDFVADTMALMCRYGFASENRFKDANTRYEHRHLGQHHDHMICTKCGRILEFRNDDLEALQLQIAAANGFHLLQHRMELYGICDRCRTERIRPMPLIMAKAGETAIIEELGGGAGLRMRLLAMGLRLGDRLDIITNLSDGQVVVAIEGRRYALGRGMARQIMVRLEENGRDRNESDSGAIPLSTLREGQHGTIVRVGGSGPLRRRLLEMGILKGVELIVEKYAPLKDPMELIVKGYHVSLRVEEADHILVRVLP